MVRNAPRWCATLFSAWIILLSALILKLLQVGIKFAWSFLQFHIIGRGKHEDLKKRLSL